MLLKVGMRLSSQVCSTQAIVVRAPGVELDVSCGGQPMVSTSLPGQPPLVGDPDTKDPSLLGKRYGRPAGDLELLIVRAGDFAIAVEGDRLVEQQSKQLPSSD
jgi:hypothetical protein